MSLFTIIDHSLDILSNFSLSVQCKKESLMDLDCKDGYPLKNVGLF